MKLILASTSPYRRELLQRLAVPFEIAKPLIDEEKEKHPRFSPRELAEHLAQLKAKSLATHDAIVIGGDQLVSFEGQVLGKPHTKENAVKQLQQMSGKVHELVTAICLVRRSEVQMHTDLTRIWLKSLTTQQIQRIVELDNPVDCAGSYKIEAHGIALVEKIETEDFTAIQGLPLIALSRMLKTWQIDAP
jgi:septum formation protein